MVRPIVVYSLVLSVVFASPALAAPQPSLGAAGTWTSDDGDLNGTWQATFVVEEYSADGAIQQVGGSIAVTGMPGVAGGKVSGNIKPGTIKFGILYDDEELATFDGVVARDAKLLGRYTRPDGTAGKWEGNWTHSMEQKKSAPDPKPKAEVAAPPTP